MQHNATLDQLTGVLNRREGFMAMEALVARSHKEKKPVSICLIDLNNLKYINDHFGQFEGDEVIIKTARILSGNVKKSDCICRLGGDEFLIVLQRCNRELAELVLCRIEGEIEKYNATCGKPFNISWCCAVEEWNDQTMDTIEDLVKKAGEKLAEQKKDLHGASELTEEYAETGGDR